MYVIGVDVGTGSARAGVFDRRGTLLASAVATIKTWRPKPDFVEQSSEDIWLSVTKAVKEALQTSRVESENVVGICFDATCSLVALDMNDQPVSVSPDGSPEQNIIVWMDHRALIESEEINGGHFEVLKYIGGKISPEMETPKLLWLKRNLPETWRRASKFFDLADFLTYRASGSNARSLCTVVCKWTFLGHEGASGGWDKTYFNAIGLEELLEDDKIGSDFLPMGAFLGNLTPQSAQDLGLTTNCAVGAGMIDAHAGGLGLLGAIWKDEPETNPERLETALALIGGTSSCHMAVSRSPKFIDGIWGPYFGAMVPGMWLTEGGQSSAGSAIDHAIQDHSNYPRLVELARERKKSVYEILNAEIERLTLEKSLPFSAALTKNIHSLPYYLGNRSPNADPHATATLEGLTLDDSLVSQALRYYSVMQGVAYGTRDIVRAMNASGYQIETLFVTGGGTKNPLWLQEHADATGLTLILAKEPEAVLLGSAILAATASGIYDDLPGAMKGMSDTGEIIRPNPKTADYHSKKFEIFQSMYREQLAHRRLME